MSIRRPTLTFVVVVVCCLSAAPARAQSDAKMDEARQHFETAMDLSDKGEWKNALAEFDKAYAAKQFPAFLYNVAVCHEKLKDYPKAVENFRRYLTDDPKASDKAAVEKRIAALEAEIARAEVKPPSDGTAPPPETAPPVALPEVNVKGLVVIESKPPGASIFLDDKAKGAIGQTPWNGSFEGEHTLILESKGYKTEKKKITPSSDKLVWLYIALSEEHYLGWLEVRANIPAAEVFIDRVDVGAVGRTPFMGNVQPGKHKIIVTREGYTQESRDVEIEPGKAHNVEVSLAKAPVGFVHVRGETVEGARVLVDGKEVCKAPCRFPAPAGDHELRVSKKGRKTYARSLSIGRATEVDLQVKLARKPGNAGAYWKLFFGAVFVGGGVYLGMHSNDIYDDIQSDIDAGMPPPASDDSRFLEGKAYAWGADAAYVVGGITLLLGVWDLLDDEGPSSTGVAESRDLAVTPLLGPDYAGLAGEVRW